MPADTPTARPLDELMAAIPGALLTQVNVTPPMVLPLLSFAVAVNCWVALATMVGAAGVTAILATTGAPGSGFELEEPPPQPTRRTHAAIRKERRAVDCPRDNPERR